MASPFRAFRKHQKTLIVVAGVVLMFVFVLSQPLTQYLRGHSPGDAGGKRRPGDVAVQWKGGSLTNAELGQLVGRRLILNNFLRQVQGIGQQSAQEAGGEPQPLRVAVMIGPERPEQGVERDVLRTRLFADAARKAGMVISDAYLVDYLQQLGRGYVSVDMIRQIIASNQMRGRGVSIDYILEALREETLARNYLASYYYALDTELPEDRWRDWLRANDRVVVEAVAVPAESLLVDVKDPSEAELVAFFNEYKDLEPIPDRDWGVELPAQHPAFAIPQKVATQFLLADFNQFLSKVEDEVTDAEIAKFYEDNKDPYFIRAESVLSEPGDVTGAKSDATTDEKPPAAAAEPKAGDASSQEPAPKELAPLETQPNDDTKSAPKTNDGSALLRTSPFRLAAYAEDAPAAGSPAAAESSPATPAATNEKPEPKADEPAPKADDGATAPEVAAPTAELAPPTEKPKVFQPLDEVRDQIRRQIAEAKVSDQLEQLMTTVNRVLEDSYTEYFGASLDAADKGNQPPPPPAALLDLTPLATKYGLVYQKTEPASMLQLRDTPVGASVRRDQGNIPFYYSVFGRDVELYQPISTYDLDNNRYLAMKTQDIPGKVPTLDEVRSEVVHAWKLREAGKLAVTRAEEMAKKAQDNGGTLAAAFADDKSVSVIKTDPFAFFTIGAVSRDTQQVQTFRLSAPDGIVAAGPEFMEKVFALKEGEVAAAPNHDHTIAYVVRVAEHQNSPAELQQAFLGEDYNWYGVAAMSRGHFQTALATVVNDVLQSAEVDWKRDPDQVIKQEEAEAGEPSPPST